MKRSLRMTGAAALAVSSILGVTACGSSSSKSTTTTAAAHPATGFTRTLLVNAVGLTHSTAGGARPVIGPDDMAYLGGHLFVGFQNGVGSMGETSPAGNKASTIIEFDLTGKKIAQWDVVGKNDGLTADPSNNRLIATVNEDGNSSLYLIDPTPGSAPQHYHYNNPLPHGGGTDAVSVDQGMVLITASAPSSKGNPAKQPALYRVTFNSGTHLATLHGVFNDASSAASLNTSGKTEKLALSDPDSVAIVPASVPHVGGDFVVDSQGDQEEIFVHNPGAAGQSLSVLKISGSVDDMAWPTASSGALYTTDNVADAVYKITGPFAPGQAFVSVTPCNANNAPATCPAPPKFPQNYLGQLNPQTGTVTPVTVHGVTAAPKGMLFVP